MVKVNERIEKLEKQIDGEGTVKGVSELISDDGTTQTLFGYIVTIADGAITLTAPSEGE